MQLFGIGDAKSRLPSPGTALPGRQEPIATAATHFVSGLSLHPPFPAGTRDALFGLGCFWGAERLFWTTPGVVVTAVGYAGGETANPTYDEVCSGRTGHAEVVRVVWDPAKIGFGDLVRLFFEAHDPTQGMRQGNDVGTQYRSVLYTGDPDDLALAMAIRDRYAAALAARGRGPVTTEIGGAMPFYPAETLHQQYLAKNPGGYCGLAGTGVACPLPAGEAAP